MKVAGSVALICGWFLFLIRRAFAETLNVDDITNLVIPWLRGYAAVIKGCVLFWTGAIRPLGGLFYLLVFQFAGFSSLPFRVAAIAFLVLNLVLLYFVLRRLLPGYGFALVGVIFFCYNRDLSDMYMSSGTVYDTLGLTFTLLALLCVMRDRPRWLLAALCTIAAVDSKEMGVAIPALILAYELIVRRRPRFAAVISTGIVAAAFLVSRLAVKNELSALPAYRLTVTWQRLVETTQVYLNDVIVSGHMSGKNSILLLLLALCVSLVLRNRVMIFGWCYYLIALMPMSFATPRAGYAVYIPYAGVAIYIAAFIYDRRWKQLSPAIAAVAICLIGVTQYRQERFVRTHNSDHAGGMTAVQTVGNGIFKLAPTMPKGAHVLLINDPFETDEELPHSTLRLRYRDPSLSTTKMTWKKSANRISYPPDSFDHVFLFEGDSVTELPNKPEGADAALEARAPSYVAMGSKLADLSIVKDIGARDASPQRWVNQNPEFLFRVPPGNVHFEMRYTVPEVILQQTKTLDIEAWIADQPAPPLHITEAKTYVYTAPLPAKVKAGERVTVRFHVRQPFIAKDDGAKLAFLLTAAGFVQD